MLKFIPAQHNQVAPGEVIGPRSTGSLTSCSRCCWPYLQGLRPAHAPAGSGRCSALAVLPGHSPPKRGRRAKRDEATPGAKTSKTGQQTYMRHAAKENTCEIDRPADPATTWPRSLAERCRQASYQGKESAASALGTWEWRPLNAISEATA